MNEIKKAGVHVTSFEVKVTEGHQDKIVVNSDPLNYEVIDGPKEPYVVNIFINGIYTERDYGPQVEKKIKDKLSKYLAKKLMDYDVGS